MKRCGNCGHELKMRSFRPLLNDCPYCGQHRFSKAHQTNAMRATYLLYGGAGCVALKFFWHVPYWLSVPLLLGPLAFWLWRYYRLFPEEDGIDETPEEDLTDETA